MARRSIDLHGKTIAEVDSIIDRFLYEAQQAGYDNVRIVTGKGTGKVQAATIKYLKLGGYPWSYEKLGKGKQQNKHQNQGVLIVHLG